MNSSFTYSMFVEQFKESVKPGLFSEESLPLLYEDYQKYDSLELAGDIHDFDEVWKEFDNVENFELWKNEVGGNFNDVPIIPIPETGRLLVKICEVS